MQDYEKDRAEIASEEGFEGTVRELVEWLQASLAYGGARILEPAVDDLGREAVVVETVTGGYSSDEHLLGRLQRVPLMAMSWSSSHAGGLVVYSFQPDQVDDPAWKVNLPPEAEGGPDEVYARARELRVEAPDGTVQVIAFPKGIEVLFTEDDRDVLDPRGELVVRGCTDPLAD